MASSAPSQHTVEFFRNAAHTVIHGANFMSIANSATRKDGFQLLQEHVAPAAFHNSWQRADPPRCHAHTREAVLEELFDWIVGHIPREAWMAWLNGAAGAGKSAICQSFAELCIARGVKAASFFFFRTDASRNTLDPVIATLAYQIIQLFPETKELIVRTIEANPLIFEQAFETQLDALIVAPIRRLQQADASFTLLLIIDGLDECTEERPQMVLVEAFGKLLRNKDLPLLALFGSRRESHIQMTFNVRHVDGILKQMPLDNNYQAPADIRRFLVERFADIKLTHPQNKRLDSAWPAADHVQQIVEKSSGQFVYASVIVKFASMPSPNPATQLDIVRGLRPAGRTTPFAELDALYRHIFSQVKDIAPALRLLAYNILGSVTYVKRAFYFFDIREDEAESIFAPLASVLSYDAETARITFHHTSLPDFLKDKERPQEYCISEMGTDLSILWFKNAISGRFKDLSEDDQNFDILRFLDCAKGCPDLRALILYYPPPQTPWAYKTDFFPPVILRRIREIDFGDNGEAYRTISDRIVRHVAEVYPHVLPDLAAEFTTMTSDERVPTEMRDGPESAPVCYADSVPKSPILWLPLKTLDGRATVANAASLLTLWGTLPAGCFNLFHRWYTSPSWPHPTPGSPDTLEDEYEGV